MHVERAHKNPDDNLGGRQIGPGDIIDAYGYAFFNGDDFFLGLDLLNINHRAICGADNILTGGIDLDGLRKNQT